MNLMHIKLKSGIDLIAYVIDSDSTHLTLQDPVQFGFDPNNGIFGIDWLLLSETTTVKLPHADVYFSNVGSAKANQFYTEFTSKLSSRKDATTDYAGELENMLQALMESKSNIKH